MKLVVDYCRELWQATIAGWNRFWFTPDDPATLCLIRVLAGGMLLYTHAVWTLGLEDFFGPRSWVSPEAARLSLPTQWAWSYLWWIESPQVLWIAHIAALVVLLLFTLGLATRVTSVLAFLITVAYINRTPGALFGLDQVNAMLAMYLMLGPCGAEYSLDRYLARRRGRGAAPAAPSVSANVAIRLIQVHMCIIYFFAGLSKLQGDTWWSGTALWGAAANYEYQTLDLTFLAAHPFVVALLTTIVVYWELFFCVIVWPRLLRPITMALAVPLHLGIAFGMGMITFGIVMLFGVASFTSPKLVRRLLDRRSAAPARAAAATLPAARPSGAARAAR